MKSLAIWSNIDESDESPEIDLHINFWKLPSNRFFSKNKFDRFIDIGFQIKKAKSLKSISLYIPFIVKISDVFDLGKTICSQNADLLNAVFNEQYTIATGSTSNYHKITNETNDELFSIYAVDKEKNITIDNRSDGSIVKIKMPSANIIKENTYMRIRIQSENIVAFSTIEKNPTSILNNAFTKTEILDFRVNSSRHLPNTINELIIENDRLKLLKIHFFYICSYKENYILSHTPFSGARKLEDELWEKYISESLKNNSLADGETFVAYQWTKKSSEEGGVKRLNILMKTEFQHKNWLTIFTYLLFILIFTILSGILTNGIYDKIKEGFPSEEGKVSSPEKN